MTETKRLRRIVTSVAVAGAIAMMATAMLGSGRAATAGAADAADTAQTSTTTTTRQSSETSTDALDHTALELGDGKVSPTSPERGSVYSCVPTNYDGNVVTGPWLHGSTWDYTAKPTVSGDVEWDEAAFSAEPQGSVRWLTGSGLPTTETGVFPIEPDDDAYAYEGPVTNSIQRRPYSFSVTASPKKADERSCLPGGPIGVLKNGALLFNALDAHGYDAPAHEMMDECGGHPDPGGAYHYHALPSCLDTASDGEHSSRIGWAADGFPIYGPDGEDGQTVRNADLDACHGHTHPIRFNGNDARMYHYHATMEYPYTLGCFRGAA